jgi:hypothetical protein
MARHFPRCQGFAVADYGFTLGRLEADAARTLAQFGYKFLKSYLPTKEGVFYVLPLLPTRFFHEDTLRPICKRQKQILTHQA